MFARLATLLRSVFRRSRLEADMDAELRFHLQARADDLQRGGMPRGMAERQARLEFGAVDGWKDDCRRERGLALLDEVIGNLRYASRSLLNAPGVTAAALISLALGIGANTAIFSLVNAVALKRLPVEDPGRLVLLSWTAKGFPARYVDSVEGSLDKDPGTGMSVSSDFSSATVEALAAHNRVFSHVLAYSDNPAASNISLGTRGETGQVVGVSGNYFEALGVGASAGRVLHPGDDEAGAEPVAVISRAFWQRVLGGRSAPGAVLVVNGASLTVVGVAPREFGGLQPGLTPDLYIPLQVYVEHFRRAFAYDLRDPRVWWLTAVGRLRPGISAAQAASEAAGLFRGSLGAAQTADGDTRPSLVTRPFSRGVDRLRKEFSPVLLLLTAMVTVVLLVSCANIASLLAARAAARTRDLAVRLSLGASRGRIARELLTESVLLGLAGGGLGLLVGVWTGQAMAAALAEGPRDPVALTVGFDGAVLVFTLLVSIASGVLFGVVPALRATWTDPARALTRRSDTALSGGRTARSGKVLVGAQVALSLSLLIGAGLLATTLVRLQRVELGFDPQNLVTLQVQPGLNGYADGRLAAYYENLERQISAVPGVRAVGLSQLGLIGSGWSQGRGDLPDTTPPQTELEFWRHWVSPEFFEAVGVPLVAGRLLGPADGPTAPRVVVVNRRFVDAYLHGIDPVGRAFKEGEIVAAIVGVVGDTKYGSLRDAAPPTVYFPYLQYRRGYPASMTVHVRIDGRADAVMRALQRTVVALDSTVPPVSVLTEQRMIDRALFTERALAAASVALGLLALVLACVGMFGTMSVLGGTTHGRDRRADGARRTTRTGRADDPARDDGRRPGGHHHGPAAGLYRRPTAGKPALWSVATRRPDHRRCRVHHPVRHCDRGGAARPPRVARRSNDGSTR